MNTHLLSAKPRRVAPYLSFQPRIRFVACAILSLCLALTARAADITVTNTADSGSGSLRQALADAPAGGSISFNIPTTDSGYNSTTGVYTIGLGAHDDLIINSSVTITGPGAGVLTIDGQNQSRIFQVNAGPVTISGLTMTRASLIFDLYEGDFGGSAIKTADDVALTLNNITISNCTYGQYGQMIYNAGGSLAVNYCTISGNRGDGIDCDSDSQGNASPATISYSTLSTNRGAGVDVFGIHATISNCTISGNQSGGIEVIAGDCTVTDSTINGNTGNGGIMAESSTLTISNSTITGNTGSYSLTYGDPNDTFGTGGVLALGSCAISNSIIAGNTANHITPDVYGTFTSQGYNLIGATDGSTGFGATGDQVGTAAAPLDPVLGPLQDNGGPTFTEMPLTGSPTIDAGNPAFNVQSLYYDQRGYQRIANGRLDIGAVETGSYLNEAPTAVAGPNATAHAGKLATLNGSSSFDDNTPTASLGYAWTFYSRPAGSTAVLKNATTATPSFTPDKVGNYQVQLIVTDNGTPALSSAPVAVTLSSYNQPPTAVASASTNLPLVGQAVTLSSAGSSDPDGDAITYKWTLTKAPAGSHAVIVSPTSPTTTIKPDVKGTYVVTLTPSDFLGAGTPATATFSTTSVENLVHQQLTAASAVVAALPLSQVTSLGNKLDFIYRLQHANKEMLHGRYLHTIIDIELDVIRTDGVPMRGKVDTTGLGRDWILSASAQKTVYGELIAARNALLYYHDCDDHQEIDNY